MNVKHHLICTIIIAIAIVIGCIFISKALQDGFFYLQETIGQALRNSISHGFSSLEDTIRALSDSLSLS